MNLTLSPKSFDYDSTNRMFFLTSYDASESTYFLAYRTDDSANSALLYRDYLTRSTVPHEFV